MYVRLRQPFIRYFGTGTQKVEEELAALLPDARVVRMDQDTTGGKMATTASCGVLGGKYDILLGTQMVAKGHDIKQVTAVGIVSADTSLYLPDFRAAERTFMLLTQAAGRPARRRSGTGDRADVQSGALRRPGRRPPRLCGFLRGGDRLPEGAWLSAVRVARQADRAGRG
jgi:hypothetical protein